MKKKGKILTILLFVIILSIVLIIAGSSFNKEKSYDKNKNQITIKNDGKDLWTGILESNTRICGQHCNSTQIITLHEKGVLIDELIIERIFEDGHRELGKLRDFKIYIKVEPQPYQVDDYEHQCEYGKEIINVNGTRYTPKTCGRVKIGSHTEYTPEWKIYKLGTELDAGIYEVKLEGSKKPSWSYDWIYVLGNEITGKLMLDEWAIWGSIIGGDDAEIILNSPEDNYVSDVPNVQINFTLNITGGATLTNASLWHNGTGIWHRNQTWLGTRTGLFNETGQGILGTHSVSTQCQEPGGCHMITTNGTDIWITEQADHNAPATNKIYHFYVNGTYIDYFDVNDGYEVPWGITTYQDRIFLTNLGNDVREYYHNGTFIKAHTLSPLTLVGGIAVNKDGDEFWIGNGASGTFTNITHWSFDGTDFTFIDSFEISNSDDLVGLEQKGDYLFASDYEVSATGINIYKMNKTDGTLLETWNGRPSGSYLRGISIGNNGTREYPDWYFYLMTSSDKVIRVFNASEPTRYIDTIITEIFNITLKEGRTLWGIIAGDSDGDEGNENRTLIYDITPPNLTLFYFSASDLVLEVDTCWYSNDSGLTNYTIPSCLNISYNARPGSTTLILWVNDTTGNVNSTNVTFTLDGFIKTEGTWIFLNPQLNKQTRWINSLTVSSSLSYNYNETLEIITDTLAIPSSIKVLDSSSNLLSNNFDSTTGIVNWTGFIPKKDTTYFSISYNTTEILLNSTPWNRTLGGVDYEYYNLTIDSNSTRTITNVYSFFNFSDTGIIQNTFYKCLNGINNCTSDISSRADLVFSDNNDITGFDKVEWFISSLSNSSYLLVNKVGFPIQVSQNIEILNPPIRPFSNIAWKNTITAYNPNSFQSEKILKIELPFGSREISLDSVPKNLIYDTAGTLNPYVLIINKNDPTHPSSIYLSPGETRTFILEYTTDSVTITSDTYHPTAYDVEEQAKIVQIFRIKNQADDSISATVEHRIPIAFGLNLVACNGNLKNGCPEEDTDEFDELVFDEKSKVNGQYILEIDSLSAGEVRHITLSYNIQTAEIIEEIEGRRSINGQLLRFKKLTFQSQAPFTLDNVRYKSGIENIVEALECFQDICETPLRVDGSRVFLGSFEVSQRKTIYIWSSELEEVEDIEEVENFLLKLWYLEPKFEIDEDVWYYSLIGFLAVDESGKSYIYLGQILVLSSGFILLIAFLILIMKRRINKKVGKIKRNLETPTLK